MTELARAEVVIGGDNSKLKRALREAETGVSRAGVTMDRVGRGMQISLLAVAGAATAAATAIGTISVGLIRSAVQTGSFLEDARLSLDALLGSAEQGARAMELLNELAGRVPQTFQELISASGSLGAAADGSADDLAKMVEIAADIQATLPHLRLEEVAANLQRAFSGGIASAELFRDRGVSAMLGFEQGVSVSGAETKRIIMEMWEEGTNSMVGATERMATNWTGIVSMLQDTWFRFTKTVAEAGVFEAVKGGLDEVRVSLNELVESGALERFARAFSAVVVPAIGRVIDEVVDLLNWIDRNQKEIADLAVSTAASARIMIASLGLVGATLKNLVDLAGDFGSAMAAAARFDAPGIGMAVQSAQRNLQELRGHQENFIDTVTAAWSAVLSQVSGISNEILAQVAGDAGAGAGGGGGGGGTTGTGGKSTGPGLGPAARGMGELKRVPVRIVPSFDIADVEAVVGALREHLGKEPLDLSNTALAASIAETVSDEIGKGLMSDRLTEELARLADRAELVESIKQAGVSIGRSLVQGIINGTFEMADFLRNTMAMIVDIFVKRELENLLGVASPSKVTMAIGREVGRGLALGIAGQSGAVAAAVGGLADLSSVSGSTSVRASARAGLDLAGAGPGLTIENFNIQGVVDERTANTVIRRASGEIVRTVRDARSAGVI